MDRNRLSLINDNTPTRSNVALSPLNRMAMAVLANDLSGSLTATHMREQARAYLTNLTLENLAALSSLEAQLSETAPSGAARYQLIVDAYSIAAMQKIVRW